MGKIIFKIFCLFVMLGSLITIDRTKDAWADVQVNINLGPPPIVVAEPPELVLIPGSQIYFVPHPEIDIFFYNNYWWSPRGSRWYRARAYKGPWVIVTRRYIPAPVYRVPREYRVIYERERRIPYGQWKKEFRHREREEHREWREDRREHRERPGRGHGRE
ncbi:MAG: hypothetical protein HY879_15640 [Deltaproteobacteria bacterium]|nr:hypothetical protein [Deltaproteobacteria bacterium]